jgi:hypothetical protein
MMGQEVRFSAVARVRSAPKHHNLAVMRSEFIVRVANMQDTVGVTALLEASYISQLEGGYSQLVLAKALPLMTRANPRLLGSGT